MRNKIVGYIIIGIALVIGFIVYSFNRALTEIASASCTHGVNCPMWGTISFQTNMGLGLMILVILIGLYFVFFMKEKRLIKGVMSEKVTIGNYQEIMKELNEDEKKVLKKIIEAEGTIFQSEIVERTSLDKVKVTRILDRLEGRGLIERKRRGMTNIVILKHHGK